MPYHFIVDGRAVWCDTPDELRQAIAVVDRPLPRTQVDDLDDLTPSANGSTLDPLLTEPLPRLATSGNGQHVQELARRKRRRATSSGTGSAAARSWREAKREARRQGRTDIAAVRSELAAARA